MELAGAALNFCTYVKVPPILYETGLRKKWDMARVFEFLQLVKKFQKNAINLFKTYQLLEVCISNQPQNCLAHDVTKMGSVPVLSSTGTKRVEILSNKAINKHCWEPDQFWQKWFYWFILRNTNSFWNGLETTANEQKRNNYKLRL